MNCIHPQDVDLAMQEWSNLSKGTLSSSFELRWKSFDDDKRNGQNFGVQWTLAACVSIFNDDGSPRSIAGCITDITSQKKRVEDVLEAKRQHEKSVQSCFPLAQIEYG